MEEKVSLKDSFVGIGQKLGKAIMMPISILPVAGLFLGIAAALSSGAVIKAYSVLDNSFLQGLFKLMNAVGNGVFGALPLIFAGNASGRLLVFRPCQKRRTRWKDGCHLCHSDIPAPRKMYWKVHRRVHQS